MWAGGVSAYSPCWTMRAARSSMEVCVNVWRYLSITFLCHLPTSQIVLVSTLVSSNTMAPPDRIECALILAVLKPTFGPDIITASQIALVISVLLIVYNFTFWGTYASG